MERNVLIEIAKTGTGYGAHAPNLPGCAASGKTLEETRQHMLEALEWHLESLANRGEEIPGNSEYCEILSVKMPEPVET